MDLDVFMHNPTLGLDMSSANLHIGPGHLRGEPHYRDKLKSTESKTCLYSIIKKETRTCIHSGSPNNPKRIIDKSTTNPKL
ncbi:hypothetical protein NC651_029007 [Populus alba x Populus x berolinensis]|nr:hypothetical protein NC651_029007 [Populus alba x Populus x berolinensis]